MTQGTTWDFGLFCIYLLSSCTHVLGPVHNLLSHFLSFAEAPASTGRENREQLSVSVVPSVHKTICLWSELWNTLLYSVLDIWLPVGLKTHICSSCLLPGLTFLCFMNLKDAHTLEKKRCFWCVQKISSFHKCAIWRSLCCLINPYEDIAENDACHLPVDNTGRIWNKLQPALVGRCWVEFCLIRSSAGTGQRKGSGLYT